MKQPTDNDQAEVTETTGFNRLPQEAIEDANEETKAYRELAVEPALPPLHVVLDPPVEYDGKKYSELVLDFEKLVGKDFQRAERDFNRLYRADRNELVLPDIKQLYSCLIAAQAADVPIGLILKLPGRIYNAVRTAALKASGGSPEEEKA